MSKIIVYENVNDIDGLMVIEPIVFTDNRGYLFESYNVDDYIENKINAHFVQDNEVFSKKNVLRGFHLNLKSPQSKLIHVVSGRIIDVVIDLRKNSRSFKKSYKILLSDSNHKHLFIPEGFAHAYLAEEDSHVIFKSTTHYSNGDEIGIAWNSDAFNIDWGVPETSIIQNEKDRCSLDWAYIEKGLFENKI